MYVSSSSLDIRLKWPSIFFHQGRIIFRQPRSVAAKRVVDCCYPSSKCTRACFQCTRTSPTYEYKRHYTFSCWLCIRPPSTIRVQCIIFSFCPIQLHKSLSSSLIPSWGSHIEAGTWQTFIVYGTEAVLRLMRFLSNFFWSVFSNARRLSIHYVHVPLNYSTMQTLFLVHASASRMWLPPLKFKCLSLGYIRWYVTSCSQSPMKGSFNSQQKPLFMFWFRILAFWLPGPF